MEMELQRRASIPTGSVIIKHTQRLFTAEQTSKIFNSHDRNKDGQGAVKIKDNKSHDGKKDGQGVVKKDGQGIVKIKDIKSHDGNKDGQGVVKIKDIGQLLFTVEQIKKKFISCDRNKDGQLSEGELTEAFNQLGSSFPRLRAHLARNKADHDNDGFIDLNNKDEFSALIDYAHSCGYKVR